MRLENKLQGVSFAKRMAKIEMESFEFWAEEPGTFERTFCKEFYDKACKDFVKFSRKETKLQNKLIKLRISK